MNQKKTFLFLWLMPSRRSLTFMVSLLSSVPNSSSWSVRVDLLLLVLFLLIRYSKFYYCFFKSLRIFLYTYNDIFSLSLISFWACCLFDDYANFSSFFVTYSAIIHFAVRPFNIYYIRGRHKNSCILFW